jgi:hypothetical protein
MSRITGQWDHVVKAGDLFRAFEDGVTTFEETRDAVVVLLRMEHIGDEDFTGIVADLESAADEGEFNAALDDLWDWGDTDKRLWFEAF